MSVRNTEDDVFNQYWVSNNINFPLKDKKHFFKIFSFVYRRMKSWRKVWNDWMVTFLNQPINKNITLQVKVTTK